MASSCLPPAIKDGKRRNWTELPPELTSSILHRLGAIEVLENAQKVCKSWLCVCKDPSMWQKIDMHINLRNTEEVFSLLNYIHLLFGNRLTNVGLNAILDNCPNLEHLDLRQCFMLKPDGDLEKRCSEKIKVVRFPNDSIKDYPYDAMVEDMLSSEDEFSDEFYDELSDSWDFDPFEY